jgi:hypothetical protein
MALQFDLYLGDWPARYGGVRKVIKGAIPRVLTVAPSGSFKAIAKNKLYLVIKESPKRYVGYIKNLANPGNEYIKAFTFETAAEAEKMIKNIVKK